MALQAPTAVARRDFVALFWPLTPSTVCARACSGRRVQDFLLALARTAMAAHKADRDRVLEQAIAHFGAGRLPDVRAGTRSASRRPTPCWVPTSPNGTRAEAAAISVQSIDLPQFG